MSDNDPYIQAAIMPEATSRADLIYNEAMARLFAAHGRLTEAYINTPPASPAEYSAYLIGPSPDVGSAWEGLPGKIAIWIGGWKFMDPQNGFETMVETATSGQNGRRIGYHINGWSSTGGIFTAAPFEASPGQWEVDWNLRDGQVMRVVLNQPTITLNQPVGWRYGQKMYLLAVQDGAGGRNLVLKTSQFETVGGAQPVIATGPNQKSLLTFILGDNTGVGPLYLGSDQNIIPV